MPKSAHMLPLRKMVVQEPLGWALVGGASLNAEGFARIAQLAVDARG